MKGITLLLALSGLSGGISNVFADTIQSTTGSSSPAIIGDNNKIVINDIDARALKRLNDELDAKDLTIAQKTEEAEEWARKYRELNQQLIEAQTQAAAAGDDTTLFKTAQDLLHEGKLEEAGKIYDQLLGRDESNIDRAAQDHFTRAQIYALQFLPLDALPHYAKAYQYRPENFDYARGYAHMLWIQKDYKQSESVIEKFLPHLRDLAGQNPTVYRPYLAITLSNLGGVYARTQRFGDAEGAFVEALTIQRQVDAQNPAARADLAGILNNLANVYRETKRIGDAEDAYKGALAIRREFAARNPAAYRPLLADTLINLGTAYGLAGQFDDAEGTNKEAVEIYRDLAAQNAAAYRPDLAVALMALGNLFARTHRFDDAVGTYKEALAIQRDLAVQNPAAYLPDMAATLTDLGETYDKRGLLGDAQSAEQEALTIWRPLAGRNAVYSPELATTLNSLGAVYEETYRFDDAESAYTEALAIRRELAVRNPPAYRSDLIATLTDLSKLYFETGQRAEAKAAEDELSKLRQKQ